MSGCEDELRFHLKPDIFSDCPGPTRFPDEIAEQIRNLPDINGFVIAVVRKALKNRSEGVQFL